MASGTAATPNESRANLGSSFMARCTSRPSGSAPQPVLGSTANTVMRTPAAPGRVVPRISVALTPRSGRPAAPPIRSDGPASSRVSAVKCSPGHLQRGPPARPRPPPGPASAAPGAGRTRTASAPSSGRASPSGVSHPHQRAALGVGRGAAGDGLIVQANAPLRLQQAPPEVHPRAGQEPVAAHHHLGAARRASARGETSTSVGAWPEHEQIGWPGRRWAGSASSVASTASSTAAPRRSCVGERQLEAAGRPWGPGSTAGRRPELIGPRSRRGAAPSAPRVTAAVVLHRHLAPAGARRGRWRSPAAGCSNSDHRGAGVGAQRLEAAGQLGRLARGDRAMTTGAPGPRAAPAASVADSWPGPRQEKSGSGRRAWLPTSGPTRRSPGRRRCGWRW